MVVYEVDSEILRSNPFAFVVSKTQDGLEDCHEIVCDFCLKRMPMNLPRLLRCAKCKLCHYCDQNCQRNAWISYHRKECILIRRIIINDDNNYITDMERLITRIVVKLTYFNGNEESEQLPNGQIVHFRNLVSNVDQIRNSIEHKGVCQVIWNGLNDAMGEAHSPSLGDIEEIFGKIKTNHFRREMGFGIFLAASKFDHSCDPNTTYDMIGQELMFWPTRQVVGSFSTLRINYLKPEDLMASKEERKAKLKSTQLFDCQCNRCSNE